MNPLQSNFPDYNVQNTEKKIITFCRLQPQKNLRMAIRAFKAFHDENPEYTYHIFGKGEEKANLLKLIEELDLQKCVFIEAFKKKYSGRSEKIIVRLCLHRTMKDCLIR